MTGLALINPKYPHNLAAVVRLAAAYGTERVWFTGDRMERRIADLDRLPREERMKGYASVQWKRADRFMDLDPHAIPVAIEVLANSEPLEHFEHPPNAIYVFGPEDGGISKGYRVKCHRFVSIPLHHCLNLSTAVATVLWDRRLKETQAGKRWPLPVSMTLRESRG